MQMVASPSREMFKTGIFCETCTSVLCKTVAQAGGRYVGAQRKNQGAVWNENLSSLPSFSQGLYFASSFNVKTASYLICTFRSNVRQVSLFHAY